MLDIPLLPVIPPLINHPLLSEDDINEENYIMM
jgi:hypothetical protein